MVSPMKTVIYDCMFLSGTKGSFTRDDSEQVIEYQKAEFFQKNGGSSVSFTVDKAVDVSALQELASYDLYCDMTASNYGNSKAFRVRVYDCVPSQD